MHRAVEVFVAVQLLAAGLSHIVQPRAWVEFFVELRGKGRAGVFIVAMLQLPLGAFIIVFHNVWRGLPLVVTLFGWALTIKATIYLLAPEVGLLALGRVSVERERRFIVAGVISVLVSALVLYSVITGP